MWETLIPAILILIYLLPSMVAHYREKRNESSILIVNIFLGWTFIGWVVALSWAMAKD